MSRSTGPTQRPRYERDIEQVLRRSHRGRRRWRFPRPQLPSLHWDWQTGGGLGWALIVVAFLLRFFAPLWAPRAARIMVLVGAGLLLLGYVAALFPQQPRQERRWRGEIVALPGAEPGWRRALRRFFRRR